ncbi:hypothetical protein GCM10010124_06750 [Pilimelia terevasa]|uniref:Ferrous iron transport protein A n=1 Tax=Pilimelia terevasa TaxID=53372 RepID=A0A8J3FF67_9ACTN|nr:hypothetical protein GCM10010124_06750 [Pilimelia terevasa]
MLGDGDVGHRVVVRVRAGLREGRPVFRDHLGTLLSMSDTSWTIATRGGPVTVARADVHRAKRVPPPVSGAASGRRPAAPGRTAPDRATGGPDPGP